MLELLEKLLKGLLQFVEEPLKVKASWEKEAKDMRVHTQGVFPKEIIGTQRPNEPASILAYREAIYEPVTMGPINKALDSLFRIYSGSNYKIEYSPEIRDYLRGTLFSPLNDKTAGSYQFNDFILEYVIRIMIEDPNGLLIWLPLHPEDKKRPPDEIEDGSEVAIQPLFTPSKLVHYYDTNVCLVEWEDKFKWTWDGQKREDPQYFHISRYQILWSYPTSVVEGKVQYSIKLWYEIARDGKEENAAPVLPAIVLGGQRAKDKNHKSLFYSYFHTYLPPANDCIRAKTDNDAVRVRATFPIIEEKVNRCPICKGAGRVQNMEAGEVKGLIQCTTCKGSGHGTASLTPYSTRKVFPGDGSQDTEWVKKPSVEFLSPPTEIVKLSWELWRELKKDAEKALNLLFIEEQQSGVAKKIDREPKEDMILKISLNLFGRITKQSLDLIQAYRVPLGKDRGDNIVLVPTDYGLKTTGDLLEEIESLKQKGAPPVLILERTKELNAIMNATDPKAAKVFLVNAAIDPLLIYNSDEITSLKVTGGTTTKEVRVHTLAPFVVNTLSENKDFITKSVEVLAEEALQAIKELVEKEEQGIPPGIDPNE